MGCPTTGVLAYSGNADCEVERDMSASRIAALATLIMLTGCESGSDVVCVRGHVEMQTRLNGWGAAMSTVTRPVRVCDEWR